MNTRHNRGRTLPTAAILIAAFAAGLGLFLGLRGAGVGTGSYESILMYPQPRTLPEFTLTRADGSALTRNDWNDRWTLVFFGFTNCPDICPTTLGTMKQVRADLERRGIADRVAVDFISVDPQRDTPEQLARYAAFYGSHLVAATGTDDQLTPLTRALGVLYVRTPGANGEYTVDHSATIALIDPQARLAGLFRPPHDAARIAADLARLAGRP